MLNKALNEMTHAIDQLTIRNVGNLTKLVTRATTKIQLYLYVPPQQDEVPGIRRHEAANALIQICQHLKNIAANGSPNAQNSALIELINFDAWYTNLKSTSSHVRQLMVEARQSKIKPTRFRTVLYHDGVEQSVATTGADNRVTEAIKDALRATRKAPRYQYHKDLAIRVEHILARRRHRRFWQAIKSVPHIIINIVPPLLHINLLRLAVQHVFRPVWHALRHGAHYLTQHHLATAVGFVTGATAVSTTVASRSWIRRKWHAFCMTWQARWQRWRYPTVSQPRRITITTKRSRALTSKQLALLNTQNADLLDPRAADLARTRKTRTTNIQPQRQYVNAWQPYITKATPWWESSTAQRANASPSSTTQP